MTLNRRRFLGLAASAAITNAAWPDDQTAHDGGAALVLGGGGCRGYGHIGVIRALEKNRLKPDLVVGSSAGSLVGALYAAGLGSDELGRLGRRLTPNMLRDWIFPKLGIFGGDAIRRFVDATVGERSIESLPIRFAAVATDLRDGAQKIFDRGDLGLAVEASCSAPGLIEPVISNGGVYVDGNISAPVPVLAARRLGARRVVAVDVSFPPEQAELGDPFDALYQAFSILTRKLALQDRAQADVIIEPDLPEHHDMSIATLKALVDAGERSALAAMPALRACFARGAS
jgi:NTE family protein